jgi:hypothetical protein
MLTRHQALSGSPWRPGAYPVQRACRCPPVPLRGQGGPGENLQSPRPGAVAAVPQLSSAGPPVWGTPMLGANHCHAVDREASDIGCQASEPAPAWVLSAVLAAYFVAVIGLFVTTTVVRAREMGGWEPWLFVALLILGCIASRMPTSPAAPPSTNTFEDRRCHRPPRSPGQVPRGSGGRGPIPNRATTPARARLTDGRDACRHDDLAGVRLRR